MSRSGILSFYSTDLDQIRTVNSWSMTSNLDGSFTTYPQATSLNKPKTATITDILKNSYGNVFYTVSANGIHQYYANVAHDLGTLYPYANEFTVKLPVANVSHLDVVNSGNTAFFKNQSGLMTSANLSSTDNVATATTIGSGDSWFLDTSLSSLSDSYMSPDGALLFLFSGTSVRKYSLSTPFDLTSASFVQSASLGSQGNGYGYFKPDGTILYHLSGDLTNIIYIDEYTLSTAWDLSSASATGSLSPYDSSFLYYNRGRGIAASSAGDKLYVMSTGASAGVYRLLQIAMPTPWSLGSASPYNPATDPIGQFERGLFFKDDGTRMFSIISGAMRSYTLSVPWNVLGKTAEYTVNANSRVGSNSYGGIASSNSGAEILIVGSDTKTLNKANLATAWDLSTATVPTADRELFYTGNTGNFRVSSDGQYMIQASGDVLYSYELATAYDLSTATLIASKDMILSYPLGHFTVSDDGLTIYAENDRSSFATYTYKISLDAPWDVTNASIDETYTNNTINSVKVLINNPQSNVYLATRITNIYGNSEDVLVKYAQPTNNSFTGITFDSSEAGWYSKASLLTDNFAGLKFTPDGKKFVTIGDNSFIIHELATPWDVSTASVTTTKSINTSTARFLNATISSNGQYILMPESNRSYVYTLPLAKPWDLAAIPNSGSSTLLDTYNWPGYDIQFDRAGTSVAILTGNAITFYKLTTPWDISTKTTGGGSISLDSLEESRCFAVSSNGRYVFVPYTDVSGATRISKIRRYKLSSYWGGSATTSQTLSIPDSNYRLFTGIAFDPPGNTMYLLDRFSRSILTYSTGA